MNKDPSLDYIFVAEKKITSSKIRLYQLFFKTYEQWSLGWNKKKWDAPIWRIFQDTRNQRRWIEGSVVKLDFRSTYYTPVNRVDENINLIFHKVGGSTDEARHPPFKFIYSYFFYDFQKA